MKMYSFLCISILVGFSFSYNNGVARLPPMGFNPWTTFWCQTDCKKYPDDCITEDLFIQMMDLMVKLGLKDRGYTYFNFDDCWQADERDPKTKKLIPNQERFPNGVRYLSDYAKKNGMELGMYSDVGSKSCGGYPGGLDYESLDVETFVIDWNITYLKLDGCNLDKDLYEEKYTLWSKLLNKTGVHVVFSCSWPAYLKVHYSIEETLSKICNLWRFYDDVRAEWKSLYKIASYVAENQDHYVPYSKPFDHNDPDMITVGQSKTMSLKEQRTMMSIWSIMAAPLLISTDLRTISNDSLQILLNEEVIAIDQDPLVIQGKRIWKKEDSKEVWLKKLSGGERYALAMLNSGSFESHIKVEWSDLGITGKTFKVRDVWKKKDLGEFKDSFSSIVRSHDTHLFVISKI